MSPARRFGSEFCMTTLEQRQMMMQRHKICLLWMCMIYKALVIPRRLACSVPWDLAQNVSLELWREIGVKHVAFLELWIRMASLELWLGMANEHEELLSCDLGWRVLPVWVCVCVLWRVRWVQIDCSPWYETNKLVVLRLYECYSYWELNLELRSVVRSMVSRTCSTSCD